MPLKYINCLSAAQIKKNFVPPKRSIVHFDGKILTDLANQTGEHLAVVLSGDTPQCKQGKLLSARSIEDGTGESQADEVIASLKDWKSQSNVVAQCFDTTSSNTGWIRGAATRIEQKLERPLLWLPCRHHISELLLKDAWTSIFGDIDKSPYIQKFIDFKKIWPSLNKTKYNQ